MQPSTDSSSKAESSENKDVEVNDSAGLSNAGEADGETSEDTIKLDASADFPDGGFKAWSVVLGGWCCLFASFGWINCIGVFQDYYQRNELRGYSPSTVAWISSTETFMMFAGAPIFGKIFDSYGSRFLLLFGTFFHVFGLMMTSLATQYYQLFLAQAVCSAIGASALFYAATNPIGTWFLKNRALAFGIISSGSSVGGVLLP